MRFRFLVLLFTLAYSAAFSQAVNFAGTISGKIKDELTGESLDFAIVGLTSKKAPSVVKSFMTENDGIFQFEDLAAGSYGLKISFLGFETRIIENITISDEAPSKNLGNIKLKRSTNALDEVVITDSKPSIQFNSDTVTYNVSQSLAGAGSTASDVLKNVPMVNVDIDGKPTIAGKVNTRVFIDGKPSDFTSASLTDLLNILPSDAIEKIEVITNPDVKYSADGDGILNIVLKKGFKIGLNGALSFTAGTLGNYNSSLYTAYRTDSLSFSSSYGYKDSRNKYGVSSLRSNYNEGNISSYMNQISAGENGNAGHNLRLSADWDINKRQNLRLSGNLNTSKSSGDSQMDDHRLNSDAVEQELRKQNNSNRNASGNGVFNADYSLKFAKKNETLTAGLTWYSNGASRDREIGRFYQDPSGTLSNQFSQQNENEIANRRLEFDLDYRRPLSKFSTLSFGVQSSFNRNRDDQAVFGYDFAEQRDTLKPGLTNRFTYSENINAVYAGYNLRTRSRWSFKFGLRSEYTALEFLEAAVEEVKTKPYVNLFPSFSVNKLFKKKYNVGLSYSKRISRPRENALNPLIDDSNQSNVSFGNPYLLPSYTNQFQLSLGTYGSNWSVTPRISYSLTGGIIERFRISPDSVTFKNLGANRSLSYNLFGNYRPTKKISLSGGFSVIHVTYDSESALRQKRTGFTYRSNGSLTAQFPYKISAEAQLNYFNNTISQGRTKGSVAVSAGVRKSFLDNKLLVKLLATDPFFDQRTVEYIEGMTASGRGYVQERNRQNFTKNYNLTLSYRFTKIGRNTLTKQKTDTNEL